MFKAEVTEFAGGSGGLRRFRRSQRAASVPAMPRQVEGRLSRCHGKSQEGPAG
ncbi:MAG: hypothetical protein ACI81R_003773, partial [Bradymonadia bacterium]